MTGSGSPLIVRQALRDTLSNPANGAVAVSDWDLDALGFVVPQGSRR